jgi:hypothetical protein
MKEKGEVLMERKVEILASDTGYSTVKCAYLDENGSVKTFKFPTAVAEFPCEIQPGSLGEVKPIEYEGRYYFVGEEALKFEKYLRPTYTEEFSVVYSPLLLHEAFRKEEILPNVVCLSIALTEYDREIRFYDSFKKKVVKGKKNELMQQYCSHFKVNERDFEQEVIVLPQGVGIWLDQGSPEDAIIIDIGDRTVDVVCVSEGKTLGAPWTRGYNDKGAIQIVNLLGDYIRDKFGVELHTTKVKKILETGKFKYRGEEKDLTEVIENLKIPYAERTLVDILSVPVINSLYEEHGNLIVAGGGAYYLSKEIVEAYGIKIPEQPEFSNVRGFLKKLTEA